jgi:pimeloyl-ACP methyl ester carboxylesterase
MGMTGMSWADWKAQGRRVETSGGAVAVYDLGDPEGELVTFLHGFPSSSHDIAPALDLLAGAWRVLAIDLPGFGAADKPAGHRYTIHAAVDATIDVWDALGVTETVLVAHDYSVSLAQELLARRGEGALAVEITAVVWMNGGLFPDLHRPTVGQQFLADPEHGAEIAAAVEEAGFVSGIEVTWGQRVPFDPVATHEMFASMDEGGGVPLMHDLLAYMIDRREHADRWRAALTGSDVPMAFVWGDLDPVSGAHMIERVEELRPDTTIVRLTDVGHWPLLEAPDELAAVIDARRWTSAGAPAS